MHTHTKVLAAAGLAAASVFTVGSAATAASATEAIAETSRTEASGEPNSIIKRSATSFSSPSERSSRVHTLTQGDQVEALCYREGETTGGSFYWFMINKDGKLGYVHLDAISAPKDLRHC